MVLVAFGAFGFQSGTNQPIWVCGTLEFKNLVRQGSRANADETTTLEVEQLRVGLIATARDCRN